MQQRRIRCGLLTGSRFAYASGIALTCPGLDCTSLPPSALGLPDAPNPFALPEDDSADVVLVERSGYLWLAKHHADQVAEVLQRLERRVGPVIGLDGADDFPLGFPPWVIDHFATVIKFQGIYRDRELYNYRVGCWYSGALWTEKIRPRHDRYADRDLDKLRLSLPCFAVRLPPARRRARSLEVSGARTVDRQMSRLEASARNSAERLLPVALSWAARVTRPLDVHSVLALTHVQRLEAIRLLEGFSGKQGIVGVPEMVDGTEYASGLPENMKYEILRLPEAVRREIVASAEPYRCARVGRLTYMRDLHRHKIIVAPTGYGEITFRHAEAWRVSAALVCQDLGHVEMMFPMRDRDNVVFCRPNLSDLRSVVRELVSDEAARSRIAREGKRSFTTWADRWREHLYSGVEAHIEEVLGLRNERGRESVVGAAPARELGQPRRGPFGAGQAGG